MDDREDAEALPDMPYTRCRTGQQKVCTHPHCKDVERRELREQVARVEAIHYRVVPEHVAGPGWCHSCPTEWPCPTIAALNSTGGA
jgi:hypothetical protein